MALESAAAEQLSKIACETSRFLAEPTAAERDEQMTKASNLLQQIELPAFESASEQQFEDWVDKATKRLRRPHVCVDLFRDAWITACSPQVTAHVDKVPLEKTAEEYVDAVARELFPESRYHLALAREFAAPRRHESVRAAKAWFEFTITRYLTLVRRWQLPLLLSDAWLIHTAYDCLPQAIASQTRLWVKGVSAQEIFQQAARLEASLTDESAFVVAECNKPRALPAVKSSSNDSSKGKAAMKCHCCGQLGHFKSECKH